MKKYIQYLIYSLLTLLSFNRYLFMYIKNIYLAYFLLIVFLICLFFFYYKLSNNIKLDTKYKYFIIVMSLALCLGYSYEIEHNASLIFGSILNLGITIFKIFGFYYFLKVLIYYFLKFLNKDYNKEYKFLNKFTNHPYLYSFIFLSICYGIFLLFYYPGIINYDNANQIKEVMGFHTRYLDAINPINNSTLTNFNPIVHTILLGGFFKIGYYLNNVNLGMFFYTIIQLLIVIAIYSYAIKYSIKHKCNSLITYIILLMLGLIPIFGFYTITLVKDTLYTAFLLLFSLKIYDIQLKEMTKQDYLDLFFISLLVCLFRNNGIFIIIISLPFLFYKNKKIIFILIIICLTYFSFNNMFLSKLKVSGTSVREVLSIPFQQTARLVKLKGDNISDKDKKIIEKVLDYDNLMNDYDEDLADPVKNKYNKDASKKDLENYFIVWFKYLFKEPNIYIDAFINNVTGYFYPFENSWKVYHKLNPKLKEVGFNYHYNKLNKERDFLHNLELYVEASPLGLILNIGILTWLSVFLFICLNKNKNYLLLLPNITSITFCFLSPANTYYRYIYPTLVLIVCLLPLIKKNIEEGNKN